jgi:predicted phage tail protein
MIENLQLIPLSQISFKSEESLPYEDLEIAACNIINLMSGINANYPDFQRRIYNIYTEENSSVEIIINGEHIQNLETFEFNQPFNKVEIIKCNIYAGGNTLGIIAGVGLVALAFTGVGILGISATTVGLLGASLLFSSIFKSPKTDTKEKTDKRSVNFSGTVNTTGGGQPLPVVFGEAWTGSIVISAFITPEERGLS